MNKTLLEWVRENPVDDKFIYKGDFRTFICLIWELKSKFKLKDEDILCVGEHYAKSIKFPIVQINYKRIQYVIFYNTYSFKLNIGNTVEEVSGIYNFYHVLATKMEKQDDIK